MIKKSKSQYVYKYKILLVLYPNMAALKTLTTFSDFGYHFILYTVLLNVSRFISQ